MYNIMIGQGGIGIKASLDELAVTCLSYDYAEPPRLVSLWRTYLMFIFYDSFA